MALGEKMFEESGKTISMNITKVHPIEGVTTQVSFMSDLKGQGKFPSGKNLGSGVVTRYPHGIVDASYQGIFTSDQGDQFMWWAHEKSKVTNGGVTKGIALVSGYTNSDKISWMNDIIMAVVLENDPNTMQYKTTCYEWKQQ